MARRGLGVRSGSWLAAADRCAGPIVVVGRPRSGTRLLARLLREAGVFMGVDQSAGYLDSIGWFLRFVAPLVTSKWFPDWPPWEDEADFATFCGKCVDEAGREFFGDCKPEGVWGWKFPETLFVMPIVKQVFPQAKFIHLIRDGRNVCLSRNGFFQLTGPQADYAGWNVRVPGGGGCATPRYRDYCLAVAFGSSASHFWRTIDLADPVQLLANRFLLQMQSWVHCVSSARKAGQALGEDYLEIHYEELCRRPDETLKSLSYGLQIGWDEHAAGSDRGITPVRGATARLSLAEARDYDRAVAFGTPLLRELGYLS